MTAELVQHQDQVIKHTGLPWELGLVEAHQTLKLNGLRSHKVVHWKQMENC